MEMSVEAFTATDSFKAPDLIAEMQRRLDRQREREDRAIMRAIETGQELRNPASNRSGWGS